MKNIILIAILSFGLLSMNVVSIKQTNSVIIEDSISEKFDIKIKNDTDSDVKVINAGSGGSYSLTKGATTTIKMEDGDKLHFYEKGKKDDQKEVFIQKFPFSPCRSFCIL